MSYQIKIDQKSMKSARFISRLQKKIQKALVLSKMTQQQVAEKLGVDRSVVNRRLTGKANLTARSIAEFAYAFDMDVEIDFTSKTQSSQCNWGNTTSRGLPIRSDAKIVLQGTMTPTDKYQIERIAS